MSWDLDFISEEDFRFHVGETVKQYEKNLGEFDLTRINKNLLDPIKLAFDMEVYGKTWKEIIEGEINRQIDKSNNNSIGYFHQQLFKYIDGCEVPKNGKKGGWDIIYSNPQGIVIDEDTTVHTVFVEMKNKHNTMNHSSSRDAYKKMQKQIYQNDDCACFLVEVIAKESANNRWSLKVDNESCSHKLIRRVSIDMFYELVTGQEDAFYKVCVNLPSVLHDLIGGSGKSIDYSELILSELVGYQVDELGAKFDKKVYEELCKLSFGKYLAF